jgi:hypothetical protein
MVTRRISEITKSRSKERSVSFPKQQKVVPKGAQRKFSAQKSFQRECRAYSEKINADSAEVKGKEAPKGGLQRKINADSAEVKGEEAPKGGLQRKINADSAEVKGEEAPKGGLQ